MTGIKHIRTMLHTSQIEDKEHMERKIEKIREWQVTKVEELPMTMDKNAQRCRRKGQRQS